ncbi:MAG: Uma2 family endonuclease [Candidatus Tectomicrobia bacterium]|uniref:Uma2 family endonuclease n=1 Tax=Tectimicrobiota bacterium TaxID=2528274 RepID=A0A938B1R6_UNCTE|nr:Uma2 family endonuclease [Candidatus Tectomicrobia bacterium]
MPSNKLAAPPRVLSETDRARAGLPTMYDLPSEDPEEPGLPDEFHNYQPRLLEETFLPPRYPPERIFVATDMNLYYDLDHPLWHKRPDWFAVLGVSRFYEDRDLRLSYVLWQERVTPYLVVELLSPGTEQEDLGRTQRSQENPPTKWEVYEQRLGVPYYVVFSRYTNTVRFFVRTGTVYRELSATDQRLWLPEAGLGIGLWSGMYHGLERQWLRFYDTEGQWIATPAEQADQRAAQADQRAEQERQRAEHLAAQLKALGIEPAR